MTFNPTPQDGTQVRSFRDVDIVSDNLRTLENVFEVYQVREVQQIGNERVVRTDQVTVRDVREITNNLGRTTGLPRSTNYGTYSYSTNSRSPSLTRVNFEGGGTDFQYRQVNRISEIR